MNIMLHLNPRYGEGGSAFLLKILEKPHSYILYHDSHIVYFAWKPKGFFLFSAGLLATVGLRQHGNTHQMGGQEAQEYVSNDWFLFSFLPSVSLKCFWNNNINRLAQVQDKLKRWSIICCRILHRDRAELGPYWRWCWEGRKHPG